MKDSDITQIEKTLLEDIRYLSEFIKELKKKICSEEALSTSLREEQSNLASEFEETKKKLLSIEHEIQKKIERIKYFEEMRDNLVKVNNMIAQGKSDIFDVENLLKGLLGEQEELLEQKKYLINMRYRRDVQS
jgi:chromosome segregation ATPase